MDHERSGQQGSSVAMGDISVRTSVCYKNIIKLRKLFNCFIFSECTFVHLARECGFLLFWTMSF